MWLLGIRGSQAGDQGQGQGMRKSWSVRLALALSFLKVYLRQAEHLTIEECQSRSRSIPFMTAPSGIRVKKVKIAAYPWRSKAEAIVLERLTAEEKELLHLGKQSSQGSRIKDHQLDNANLGWSDRTGSHHHYQEDVFAEGLDAEWLEHTGPEVFANENAAAVLYFHGGGYYSGSKEEHRVLIGPLVKRLGRNIRILTINYRLAPQHPFPAALVDALASYLWLQDQSVSEAFSLGTAYDGSVDADECFKPEQIIFMGDSAGGGLALSLCLLLRDHGLAQPLSVVTWSPWLDLTQSLPSFQENGATDCIPYEDFTHRHSGAVDMMFQHQESDGENHRLSATKPKVRQRAQVYCPDSCLRIKYVSPLFETDFQGIPPVLITCGSAERFANECVLLATRLEEQQQLCRIDLHEDMPHIFPLFRFHPSAVEALDRTSAYIVEAISNGTAAIMGHDTLIPISLDSASTSSHQGSPSSQSSMCLDQNQVDLCSTVDESLLDDPYVLGPNAESDKAGADRIEHLEVSLLSDLSKSTVSLRSPSPIAIPSRAMSSDANDLDMQEDEEMMEIEESVLGAERTRKNSRLKTIVNVIDLSGMSAQLTLVDVVSEATLSEWEMLLGRGYIPTRHWPHPPARAS
ncbi:hypothetical protein BGZ51_007212 [Haplosporangium sp. Z 767]|nr:hypothetical protein BGZ51_007212 [Haplosporangium sp. Z 767]